MSDTPDSPDTYDIWVINDPDGPVLYFPVVSDAPTPPGDHVARHRQQATRATAPDGLIEGVWTRARQRLAGPPGRLVAEIADPEVEARRAAQRAATMARGTEAVAWAPEELLVEPEPVPKRAPARRSATSGPAKAGAPGRSPGSTATRRPPPGPRPAPARTPAEPAEAVCRHCFMMRRVDQIDAEGVCSFCQ